MEEMVIKSPLPVPQLPELNLSHSLKQGHRKHRTNPPKLFFKHELSLNKSVCMRNNDTTNGGAHAISFRENGNETSGSLLSSAYKKDTNLSYYEQRFEQISRIGEGSFGEVFKVRSKDDGKYYAVKRSKQFLRSENYRAERLEEVRRYEQFSNHEHCIVLHKAWEEDDRLYMQMELCHGSLEDYARDYAKENARIPEDEVWSFLLDLLLAIKGLHDQNLIHLDIKLDNILITDDKFCKLADFGLVYDLTRKGHATEGDSRYIAPEVLQGNFSKAADIFSLGCCVLELACNIELEANGPLWQQLRDGKLPQEFISELSPDLQALIKCMLEPNPSQRPDVNTLLRHPRVAAIQRWRTKFWGFNLYRKRIWRKLCNLTTFFVSLLLTLITWFDLKPRRRRKRSGETSTFSVGTSAADGAGDDDSSMQITPSHLNQSIPKNTPMVKIVNSTPLNTSGLHFRNRTRRDGANFSKTILGFESSDEENDDTSFASSDMRRLNESINDASNHEHSSSLICKKLFAQNVDYSD
ncbi:membrane-associated tyrosine- and threonine-specific cdc2-inhibitory kinase [Culicoides brevitarsis]|uniref:membrane-associated tyrosine- and threonine-specific cdc2-inhibitory kinase n=1 Tax=Culicoides brevitarsis TaxID=469753 RepID=UPI00307BFB8F